MVPRTPYKMAGSPSLLDGAEDGLEVEEDGWTSLHQGCHCSKPDPCLSPPPTRIENGELGSAQGLCGFARE